MWNWQLINDDISVILYNPWRINVCILLLANAETSDICLQLDKFNISFDSYESIINKKTKDDEMIGIVGIVNTDSLINKEQHVAQERFVEFHL